MSRRAELIAEVGCSGLCKTWNCCELCRRGQPPWMAFELEQFTDEDRKTIEATMDTKRGFLTDAGCALPRQLRPFACLNYLCKEAINARGNGN